MKSQTKIQVRKNSQRAKILVLVQHPMENGRRVDKSGRRVPAHYIETVDFELDGTPVANALLGPEVARNPMASIILDKVRAGSRISVKWKDNQNNSGNAAATIS